MVFEKFFETTAIKAGMSPLYVRMLMGQKSGLETSYFKPTISDLLEGNDKVIGYAPIIDALTINEENRLRQKVKQLTAQRQNGIEAINKRLHDIEAMNKGVKDMQIYHRKKLKILKT
jgi:hypothetical protein